VIGDALRSRSRASDDGDPPGDAPDIYAARASRAYAAMQSRFCPNGGLYRTDGLVHRRSTAAHLWPFARAVVATLDLAGVREDLVERFDADVAIAERMETLERYWDPGGDAPAYSSDVVGRRRGGDRYYDDNAWVGLALVQLERMRPGAGHLARAADLFRFAVVGWDRRPEVPGPGGVFWVEQGHGAGARNHDRNTVSNAPNAELGLHLAELTGVSVGTEESICAEEMYGWVNANLDASDDPDPPATGLFWDKLRGDDTLDKTFWSYNQGSMIGANVLLARRDGSSQDRYLPRAEAIARKALRHFANGGYGTQPPAFNAIFFRNLLLLHAATGDADLRTEIIQAMRAYTDRTWSQRRDRHDRFHFSRTGATLLDQSAMVQMLALLAWDPGAYRILA
jgi:Glycosyl hydrolase family 76